MPSRDRVLVIEARFYEAISDQLAEGAVQALESAGVDVDRISVPGALEIPPAIAISAISGRYQGFVALGCVIRGETSHYDTVANESSRGLMDLGVRDRLAIGNGILTVENQEQAEVRANPAKKDKGGDAARACLALMALNEARV